MAECAESIAARFDLKRAGSEWKGPCPVCGGHDRFHVKNGASQLILYCRYGCEYRDLANAVGLQSRIKHNAPKLVVHNELPPQPNARAVAAWGLTNAAQTNHPYLVRKGIQPHGIGVVGPLFDCAPINVRGRGNLLTIPCYAQGELATLQFIGEDGTKGFLKGAPQSGVNFTFVGANQVWVVEGFATGASLHEDTGDTVVVAFSCGQLSKVAAWAKRTFAGRPVCIMADDDEPGHKAARATGLEWRVPDFKGLQRSHSDNDYNDYVRLRNGH